MPQPLRSILGYRIAKPRPQPSPKKSRPKATTTTTTTTAKRRLPSRKALLFPDQFPDLGDLPILTPHEALSLRDVVQTMRYIRSRMFTAVPSRGFTSARTAELLNYRAGMPRLITMGHIHAVLGGSSPSRVEREVAELVSKGLLRRVRVERRGPLGEALIEMEDLRVLLGRMEDEGQLGGRTREAFWRFLRRRPTVLVVGVGDIREGSKGRLLGGEEEEEDDDDDEAEAGGGEDRDGDGNGNGNGNGFFLTPSQVDELVRAGFLTSCATAAPANDALHLRPEDRTTLTSIAHVSRFASGTVSAVGGRNALHLAGGGGGVTARKHHAANNHTVSSFQIAVPGHGRYLKLADAAVRWVQDALSATTWGQGPEAWLRERFEASQTPCIYGADNKNLYGPRWKEFWGVEWEWVLGEAVGLGIVDLFDTGSVGRGVRMRGAMRD
ncbi:hypothetical protein E4U17_001426 [Claviceps sp. LM77 group G4]|nr:hypothetical protein E4U17_001426 [Claviceps sp. LM77 group G4]KAG6085020.1 hypothetical protein E4U16_000073 [Claviceps sp. LM84 group G4]